ncbi:MAG: hypothetical protein ACFFEN_06960 [Candidatus Thorarchaeota archaeon]
MIYKVIFKAIEQFENKNLTLSFKNVSFSNPITIPTRFIDELKRLSEHHNNIVYFQNIEEVITVGEITQSYNYNYFLAILYILKKDGKKQGYLIGNVKNLGDIIIGIWPFDQDDNQLTPERILENYVNIINKPENYSNVCLISQ